MSESSHLPTVSVLIHFKLRKRIEAIIIHIKQAIECHLDVFQYDEPLS